MVLYEVNVRVAPETAAAYRDWLDGHVGEVLACDGFERATVWDDAPDADGWARLVVHYRVRDGAALEAYLEDHAPRLRADGLSRFGDRFAATRRVLHRAKAFGA